MVTVQRLGRLTRCCCLAVLCAGSVASAQDAVTATSGDPAAITRIRAVFTEVQRDTARYRHTKHGLYNFSLEGGELDGYYDGAELRKLTAELSGETGRQSEEFYFSGGRLVFIHVVRERYDRPMSGRVRVRIEHRLYFDNDRLIRRIRTQSPSGLGDLSWLDPKLSDLLTSVKLLTACAATTSSEPPECTAPDR
jgi:hypothetical protein